MTAIIKVQPPPGEVPQCRPVAAGDIIRRVTDRVVFEEVKPIIAAQLQPQQFGIGVKSGIQAYIWAAKMEVEQSLREGSDHIFIKLDQKNAHNSYYRALAQQHLDSLEGIELMADLHRASFNPTTRLVSKTPKGTTFVCDSIEGGQQGNPLVPPAYALVLDPILKRYDEELGDRGHVRAYQDDIFISGDRITVLSTLREFIQHLSTIGGELATGVGKNCCFSPHGHYDGIPEFLNISKVTLENGNEAYGFELCGAPIGDEWFCPDYLHKRANKTTESMLSQTTYTLASRCFQFRPEFLFQTNLPAHMDKHMATLNDTVHRMLQLSLGADISQEDDTLPDPSRPCFVTYQTHRNWLYMY